ncbi:MAG TPA: hypothetical protein GX510_08425 [Firmicutes bacterium]|nr:hypothetical protein [Candidatus Fermentithermobacillaceae bacterium]
MWIFWVLASLVVVGWGTVTWVQTLKAKFEHTPESRLLLLVTAAIALALGWQTARMFGPGWSAKVQAVAAIGVGVVYFDILSIALVSIWKAILTLDIDETISGLEEEEERLRRKLDSLRYGRFAGDVMGAAGGPVYPVSRVEKVEGPDEEISRLRRIVNRWLESAGMTRVRALKLESWKEEYARMSLDELVREKRRLGEERPAEPGVREQTEVRIALIEMEILSRQARRLDEGTISSAGDRSSTSSTSPLEGGGEESEEQLRRRLEEISRQAARARAEKEAFLRRKIRLSWRERG